MKLDNRERKLLKYIVNHPGQFTTKQIARNMKCSSDILQPTIEKLFDKNLISGIISLDKSIYWEPYEPLIKTNYTIYISDVYSGKVVCHFTTNIPAIYSYDSSRCDKNSVINLIEHYCKNEKFISMMNDFFALDVSKKQHYYIDIKEANENVR